MPLATDEDALRAACYEALDDDAPWGAYADWLRERGQEKMADRLWVLRAMLKARRAAYHAGLMHLLTGQPIRLPVAEFAPDGE